MQVVKKKRLGSSTISIAIELIFFAAIGLTALVMLATATTTGLNATIGFLAVGFMSIVAILAIAVGFLRKGGLTKGI